MQTVRTRTPLAIRIAVPAVLLAICAWLIADRHDRVVNENRLSAIASQIAGRKVKVHCPGPLRRALEYDTVEGDVKFDADGNPANETHLRKHSCSELDAIAEGERAQQIACLQRSTSCGDEAMGVAHSVDVLTHESIHLSGEANEGLTECRSLQTMAWTATQLGLSYEQGRALALYQYEVDYPAMGDPYHATGCAEGGPLDLNPDDPRFP